MLKHTGLLFAILLCGASFLFGHGTSYELLTDGIVGVRALYDTGEPFRDSAVRIFAPGQDQVTLQSVTDRDGIVCFRPDRPGTWVLQVRGADGHGMRINLEIGDDLNLASTMAGSNRLSSLQKFGMAVLGVWGFLATALYVKGRRKHAHR